MLKMGDRVRFKSGVSANDLDEICIGKAFHYILNKEGIATSIPRLEGSECDEEDFEFIDIMFEGFSWSWGILTSMLEKID